MYIVIYRLHNGVLMVNAAEMPKPFNKRPYDWSILQSTQEFLAVLTQTRNFVLTDLVKVTNGGENPGTWMNEDVALEFARWLSPAFAIWCNDRIKELLKVGMTTTPAKLEAMLNDPDLVIGLATQLKVLWKENEEIKPTGAIQS